MRPVNVIKKPLSVEEHINSIKHESVGQANAFIRAYGSVGEIYLDAAGKRYLTERQLDNEYASSNNLPEHKTIAQDYATRWKERMPSESQRWNLKRNLDRMRLQVEKRKDIEGFLNELIVEQYSFAHRAIDPHFSYCWSDRTFKLHCHAVTDNHGVFPHHHIVTASITYEAMASVWSFSEGNLIGSVEEQERVWHEIHKVIWDGVTLGLRTLEPQWHDNTMEYY